MACIPWNYDILILDSNKHPNGLTQIHCDLPLAPSLPACSCSSCLRARFPTYYTHAIVSEWVATLAKAAKDCPYNPQPLCMCILRVGGWRLCVVLPHLPRSLVRAAVGHSSDWVGQGRLYTGLRSNWIVNLSLAYIHILAIGFIHVLGVGSLLWSVRIGH